MECQYELTDRLAFYLCGRKPGERGGPGGGEVLSPGGGGCWVPLTTPLFAQTTRTGTTSSRRWRTGECPGPAAPLPCPTSPPASPLGRGGDHRHLLVTGAGASPGRVGQGVGVRVPARLTSAFILFFPPLPSPERRVRPKCMAQRYCPLGSRLRGRHPHPVPPARDPPAAPAALHSPAPGGAPGEGGSRSPPTTSSPSACLPAPLSEAPHTRGGVPIVVGCNGGLFW